MSMFLNTNLLQEDQMREKFSMFLEMLFYPAILTAFMGAFYLGDYLLKKNPESTGVALLPSESLAVVIPVIVDGRRLNFQVDTGSRRTIISESALGLIPPYMGSCVLTGAFGEGTSKRCYFSTLDRVEIGDVVAYDVHVAVIPLAETNFDEEIDGVLGIDFMRNYKVVFDEKNFTLLTKER